MQQPLGQLEIEWQGRTAVLTLRGEIDRSNADHLGNDIAKSTSDAQRIVLDVSTLGYLDSAALTMIHKIAENAKPLVIVAPPGSRARRLLEIAGMDTVLRIVEAPQNAFGAPDPIPTADVTQAAPVPVVDSPIVTDGNPAV
jgi:anti-anti-sigma factor